MYLFPQEEQFHRHYNKIKYLFPKFSFLLNFLPFAHSIIHQDSLSNKFLKESMWIAESMYIYSWVTLWEIPCFASRLRSLLGLKASSQNHEGVNQNWIENLDIGRMKREKGHPEKSCLSRKGEFLVRKRPGPHRQQVRIKARVFGYSK